jgi:hypothetical protein
VIPLTSPATSHQEEPLLEEEEKWATTDDEGEEEGRDHQEPRQLEEDVFVPPDGGYGWFVTLGKSIIGNRCSSFFWG